MSRNGGKYQTKVSHIGHKLHRQTAIVQFPGGFGWPVQSMAGNRPRGGHQAYHITQSTFPFSRPVSEACIRPSNQRHRAAMQILPLIHTSPLARPAKPRFLHGWEGDAFLDAVACCRPFAARTRSLIRRTSLPRRELVHDAIFARRAQISSRETATT